MIDENKKKEFCEELSSLFNRYSVDNTLNTPDFILAEHVFSNLNDLAWMLDSRDGWHGKKDTVVTFEAQK